MKWARDGSNRFPQRPYYEGDELDFECEKTITAFLQDRHGAVKYPIVTDDLTALLEKEVDDLDMGVDLSAEGDSVDGLTDFFPSSKPKIRISDRLIVPSMENRLRTTLTHEFGHVKFHGFLFSFGQMPLPLVQRHDQSPRCKREKILLADKVDWMEWQAGYASGAYLMPISHLRRVVSDELAAANWEGQVSMTSVASHRLIAKVMEAFQVSQDAARVRLIKCKFVTEEAQPPRLL